VQFIGTPIRRQGSDNDRRKRKPIHTRQRLEDRPRTAVLITQDSANGWSWRTNPEGTYWINPDELWTNRWYKSGSVDAWGNYRITIHPFTTTDTFKRGGFFIHGGKVLGSAGCIDLTKYMDTFVSDLSSELATRACQIHLKVDYSGGSK